MFCLCRSLSKTKGLRLYVWVVKSDGKKNEYRNLPQRAVLKRSGKPNLHIAVKNEKPIKGRMEILSSISIKSFYDYQSRLKIICILLDIEDFEPK